MKLRNTFAVISIMVLIFLGALFANSGVVGPTIQADEGSYLANAAAISGFPNDMFGSYHGGYSLFLVPAFVFGDTPGQIWFMVKLINALLLACNFSILYLIATQLAEKLSFFRRMLTAFVVSLYPMSVTMSGYSFSENVYVPVFLLATYSLIKALKGNQIYWLILGAAIGFLYWIHPKSLPIFIALIITLVFWGFEKRSFFPPLTAIFIAITVAWFYRSGFSPWLQQQMSIGEMDPSLHYPAVKRAIERFTSFSEFKFFISRFSGQIFYITIGTLGLVWVGLFELFRKSLWFGRCKSSDNHNYQMLSLFLIFTFLGTLTMSAIFMSSPGAIRLDHWIYGRYVEGIILPIILIGLLSGRNQWSLMAVPVALFSAIFLSFGLEAFIHTAPFNVASFWQEFYLRDYGLWVWFFSGIIFIFLFSYLPRRFTLVFVASFFIFCSYHQIKWHTSASVNAAKRSDIAKIVRENFPEGSCVGYDSRGLNSYGRKVIYSDLSFKLYNYLIERMDCFSWYRECEGPYFTYNEAVCIENDNAVLIAREENSGLYLAVKRDQLDSISIQGLSMAGVKTDLSGSNYCLTQGCFSMTASDLNRFSQVGEFIDNALVTTGQKGYLFYGPYTRLRAGSYYVALDMALINPGESRLDIVHNKGSDRIIDVDLSNYATTNSGTIKIPFELKNDINDIEVRLRVSENTALKVFSYSILLNDGHIQMPTPKSYLYRAASPIIKSQTGVLEGGRLYSKETAGFLAFGPYRPLRAGKYLVIVSGEASHIEQAFVDVVSGIGQTVHAKFMLSETVQEEDGVLLRNVFVLDDDVQDLEIRLWASKKDIIILDGYSIHPVQ